MTLKEETGEETLRRTQAEAAAWIALLHSPQRNAELEAGLKRWIAADPIHAKVWEVATDVWNDTSGMRRRLPLLPVRSSRSLLRPVLAVVLLCCVVGGILLPRFLRPSVSTAIGEQRTLNLEDGTRVELNTDTRLVVKYDRESRTVTLTSGEAYFQVAREHRPFVVIAGERKILALGTAFTVRRDEAADDPVTVTLIEGRVEVAPVNAAGTVAVTPGTETQILNPGERLHVHRHRPPTLDTPSMEKATGWMRGQLIFDHTRLQDAVAEFNRYSAVKISVASSRAAAIPVGGIFRISDSKSFARAVAETYNLRLTVQGSDLVLDSEEPGPGDSRQESPPTTPTLEQR